MIETEEILMVGRGLSSIALVAAWAALLILLPPAPNPAFAQSRDLMSPPVSGPVPLTPGTGAPGSPGAALVPPQSAPPIAQPLPVAPPGHAALGVSARYGRDTQAISGGVIWRVYATKPDATGALRLVKEEKGASPTFILPIGNYVIYASLGLAGAAKVVQLRGEPVREVFEIPAGGIRLEGRVGDARIPTGQISFDVYPGSQFDSPERRSVAQGVLTGDVVLLPEGTYYIVSNYGDGNSVVRSDVHVQAAKLTDIVVNHRAALITFKLVNDPGGEALANTQWTVLTPGGDVIKESIGAFPRVVLAEGDYRVIARNEGRTFPRDFKVIAGVDGEIQVLAR